MPEKAASPEKSKKTPRQPVVQVTAQAAMVPEAIQESGRLLPEDVRQLHGDGRRLSPGQMLRLQRSVGNLQVNQLLDGGQAQSVVQRGGGDEEEETAESEQAETPAAEGGATPVEGTAESEQAETPTAETGATPAEETAGGAASPGGEEETAQPAEGDITISEAEAREDAGQAGIPTEADIRSRMASDFGVTESIQNILYMNVPEMISGMGWSQSLRDQLVPIFRRIGEGRDRLVLPAFQALQANTADPTLQAAFQAAMARFESEVGTQARRELRDIWMVRAETTADPSTVAPLAARVTPIQPALVAMRDEIFTPAGTAAPAPTGAAATTPAPTGAAATTPAPAGTAAPAGAAATTPTSLSIPDFQARRARLNELRTSLNGTAPLVAALRLTRIERPLQRQINQAFTTLQTRLQGVRNQLQATVRGARVGRLATAFADAISAAEGLSTTLAALPGRMRTQQTAALAAHPQQAVMANRLLDPAVVPILVPRQQERQVVSREGRRYTFATHQEVTFTAYESAFNLIGESGRARPRPQPLPGAAGEAGAAPADMPMPSRRALEAYQSMQREGASVSESKIVAAISSGEGSFSSTQAIDRVRFSWGLIQFQGQSLMDLLRTIHRRFPGIFSEYFESYGILLAQRGVTPTPTRRSRRPMAGAPGGVTSGEARGVDDLLVFDHRAGVWVNGNEGLNVIQRDPRYQVLFRLAAEQPQVQGVQVASARSRYVGDSRAMSVTIGTPPAQRTLAVRDFVQNEVVMFAIASRRVGGGLSAEVLGRMFTAFAAAQSIPIDDNLAAALLAHQPEMAAFVRGYAGFDVNWGRANNLAPAGIPPLSDSVYVE